MSFDPAVGILLRLTRGHSNIRKQGPPIRNGKVDDLNRTEPIEPPEITDRILQLAAVKAY